MDLQWKHKISCGVCGEISDVNPLFPLSWCPKCEVFECRKCTSLIFRCQKCNGNVYKSALFFAIIVTSMFIGMVNISWALWDYLFHPGRGTAIRVFFLTGVVFLSVIFIVLGIIWYFERIHKITLKKWEQSPEEENQLRGKRVPDISQVISYSSKRDRYMKLKQRTLKGQVTFHGYDTLIGDWDTPVYTPEEGKIITTRNFLIVILISSVVTIIGLISILSVMYGMTTMVVGGYGTMIMIMGLLVPFVIRMDPAYKKPPRYTSSATWKKSDPDRIYKVMKEHLEGREERIEEGPLYPSRPTPPDVLWVKFTFPNGIFIACTYNESNNWTRPGTCMINYGPEHHEHARELQKELDTLLTDEDLIFKYHKRS